MSELKIWILDVGHGDCAYIELPNGARMMIDCGAGDNNWPCVLLKHYKVTADQNSVAIPNRLDVKAGLDNLVISHPHGDHISDIKGIHDEIGFFLLTGGYNSFIDDLSVDAIDFKKRGKEAGEAFKAIVKKYNGQYVASEDRVALAKPTCVVNKARFIDYTKDMDLNELSWFVSFEIGGQKVLFTGDMTIAGVNKILKSPYAASFKNFVKGTTILKIPHHARANGCSQEMFDCFETKPLLAIASDEAMNDRNEETSSIKWYSDRISDTEVSINGVMQSRKVLTTRSDKDICLSIAEAGGLSVYTNCFKEIKDKILGSPLTAV